MDIPVLESSLKSQWVCFIVCNLFFSKVGENGPWNTLPFTES